MMSSATLKFTGGVCFVVLLMFIILYSIFDIRTIQSMDPLSSSSNAEHRATLQRQHRRMLDIGSTPPFPDDSLTNIDWFVQVSDIHISVYRNYDIVPDFKKFILESLPVIDPTVVMVTGDLTDAKSKSWYRSMQIKAEWEAYKYLIDTTAIKQKVVWLDIRGNHDSFNVPNYEADNNFFKEYSVQGTKKSVYSVSYTLANKKDSIDFIGFDAVPVPGPRRPYNFFGVMQQEVVNDLDKFLKKSENNSHTIVFGHYPTSIIHSAHKSIKDILGQSSVYLCGHLHSMFGLATHMYTRQIGGNLELELADWKKKRRYRILAIDHGLLSFSDQTYNQWPALLITNPKASLFNIAHRDPLGRISNSTHIRILCFTPHPPCEIEVSVDSKVIGRALRVHHDNHLYALAWNPKLYQKNGVHSMSVQAKDKVGNINSADQMFCIGFHCNLEFRLISRILLMVNFILLFKFIFWIGFIFSVSILMFCKLLSVGLIKITSVNIPVIGELYSYIFALAKRPNIINILIVYNFYLMCGPWFIGEIVDGYIGACFLYGIIVDLQFIPGSITYFFAGVYFTVYTIPLTFYVGSLCKRRHQHQPPQHDRHSFAQWVTLAWLICWLVYHALFTAYLPYGLAAGLLSPAYAWSVALVLFARYQAIHGVVVRATRINTTSSSSTSANVSSAARRRRGADD